MRSTVIAQTGHLQSGNAKQSDGQHHEGHQHFDQRRSALRLAFDRRFHVLIL
jgi:hypothetical protein